MSQWSKVLNADEIAAYHAFTATLYASFARGQREFYSSRTKEQLSGLAHGAWMANDSTGYQLARSYGAL